jgi:hypothetical protein
VARVLADVIEMLATDPYNRPPWNALSIDPDPAWPGYWIVALGEYGLLRYAVDDDARVVNLVNVVLV